MTRIVFFFLACAATTVHLAHAQDALAAARAACAADVQRLCAGVPSGGGRIIACLKQHKDAVSAPCRSAIMNAMPGAPAESPAPPPAAAKASAPAATPQPSHPAKAVTASAVAAAPTSGQKYFVMKPVQVIDESDGPAKPAYDLMVPSAWTFKGWVKVADADGGCFADWFSAYGQANSADGLTRWQMRPGQTWQYVDDPGVRQQLEQQNQRDVRYKLKPCPVRPPVHAADFLRNDLIPKMFKTQTTVSIEPDPALDRVARHRLGLPAENAGESGGIRTEAARARVAFNEQDGHAAEAWVTAVIVVRSFPSGGRGAFYDWHAMDVMTFVAPKGQLDANERLFNLIASTVRPDPKWQRYSSQTIATLYQKKHDESAKQQSMIAQFQMHVAEVTMGVVANQVAGASHAAFGADQGIRGVQTFRDPSSGKSFELSNQYDHAWRNGSNEYVMSDDPNFNPNGALNGQWNALQPVR